LNFFGFFKNCTISNNSVFSSSAQATSLNTILSFSLSYNFALDLPNVIALFAIHHIFHINNIHITKNSANAITVGNISDQKSLLVLSFIVTFVLISGFFNPKSFNESFLGSIAIFLFILLTHHSLTVSHFNVAIALLLSINISEYFHFVKFCSNTLSATF
jgi:hypothetical protein